MRLGYQLVALLVLALPVACVSWTVTHEEIFREPRDWCTRKSGTCRSLAQRKFFYVWTCEYCLSHYVAAIFLVITRYQLLFSGWRGYLVGGLALVWVANFYMGLFGRLRLDIKHERVEIQAKEQEVKRGS